MSKKLNVKSAAAVAGAAHCSALRIEQPYEIQPKSIWYFQTFRSHSGAVGGQHIPKAEVERRLEAQAGPGRLVQIEGVWHWQPNATSWTVNPCRGERVHGSRFCVWHYRRDYLLPETLDMRSNVRMNDGL